LFNIAPDAGRGDMAFHFEVIVLEKFEKFTRTRNRRTVPRQEEEYFLSFITAFGKSEITKAMLMTIPSIKYKNIHVANIYNK
jgi:hypothetical protein